MLEARDIEPEDIAGLLAGDERVATLAREALVQTRLRQTVDALGDLAAAQGYADGECLQQLAQLAPAAGNEAPLAKAHKSIGLRAAQAGRFDEALAHLEAMASLGARVGLRGDRRSRAALRFTRDAEGDAAIASLARFVPAVPASAKCDAMSLMVVVSSLVDESATTRLVVPMARWMHEHGYPICIASTEYARSEDSKTSAELAALGVTLLRARGSSHRERIESLLNQISAAPSTFALFMAWTPDVVAKVLSCSGIAPLQIFLNHTVEQFCGRFDLIVQTVSVDQNAASVNPEVSQFIPSPTFMQDQIESAVAVDRKVLGVPEEGVMLATFGRLTKMANARFVRAIAGILAQNPNAWLIIAGGTDRLAQQALEIGFTAAGVRNRVVFLHDRAADAAALLKTADLYCDTFPWCGGQTILEAMMSGTPVVAMRGAADPDLDPTGTGPRVACTQAFLGGVAPLADFEDDDAYVAIAGAYIASAEQRKEIGGRLQARATAEHSFGPFMKRLEAAMRALGRG